MPKRKKAELTTPDLVLLSLLAERPMHGYQANAELERRQVRDWAGISRPQVYYSLEKLARLGFIKGASSDDPVAGPERSVFSTSAAGRAALADALEREEWIALSWQARPGVFERQVRRREKFLVEELDREVDTLKSVRAEVGHRFHEAVWMLSLAIEQMRTELRWLRKMGREIGKRAPARHAEYAK